MVGSIAWQQTGASQSSLKKTLVESIAAGRDNVREMTGHQCCKIQLKTPHDWQMVHSVSYDFCLDSEKLT